MKVEIRRKVVLATLLGVFAILLSGHLLALFCQLYLDRPNAMGVVPIFHFDKESNLPTLFSGVQLAMASLLAFGIAKFERAKEKGCHRHWIAIGCILAYIGIDDVAHLHENVDTIIMSRVETSGLIHWPWVIPYAILAVIIVFCFLPFFLRLPSHLKFCLALSAGLFLTGALGFEMLAANHAEDFGEATPFYALLMTIEESLEMLAVTNLICGLLSHIINHLDGLRSQIEITK